MAFGGLLGVSGAGGLSTASGPAVSGLSTHSPFNIRGNQGIGGGGLGKIDISPLTLLMIGLIAIAVAITLTRGRGFSLT